MGLTGCYGFIKYLVVFVNFIFWIAGIASVALSIWMLVDRSFSVSLAQNANSYSISAYMLLAFGILLVVISFLGCCGACKESQCLLVSFSALLLVMLVAEIAATVWAYIHADALRLVVRDYVKSTVQKEYWIDEDRRYTFDKIQSELYCCGTESPRDWIEDKDIPLTLSSSPNSYLIPSSCCRLNITQAVCDIARKQIVAGSIDYSAIYDIGCVTKVVKVIESNLYIILGIGVGIIVIKTLGLIFALILAFAIGKNDRYKA